ncbi:methylthioribose kinase [Bacillus sp. 165]|uniref:DUF7147 family protein n=1 Tax=Bacillus sp. 165 TaxID=1529117 RepID=UPI001AD97405|nr:methylthioribose kinase [Bacillus sp. 165]MBO9130285.1 methylthioribose kinase [Bacillus sp. 165]
MIQRFIELGEGYSDIYELIEIAEANEHRLAHLLQLNTIINQKTVCSFVVVLQPTAIGKFQPLYICREGITVLEDKVTQRIELFEKTAAKLGKEIIRFDVKPSTIFHEKELYFNHLIAILRLNHLIPPMQ